jgi:hypothetical protein
MPILRHNHCLTAAGVILSALVSSPLFGDEPEPPAGEPLKTSFLERAREKSKAIGAKLDEIGIHPVAGGFGNGGTFAPGVSYWRPRTLTLGLDLFLSGAVSLEGDRRAELRLGRVPHRPGAPPGRREGLEWIPSFEAGKRPSKHFAYLEASGSRLAQGRFLNGASESFTVATAGVVLGYRLAPSLVASARAGITEVWPLEDAAALPPAPSPVWASVVGAVDRQSYARVSAELAWDGRHQPRSPLSGTFASLRVDHYDDVHDGGFTRATADLRHFQPLGSPRHVLAVRGLAVAAMAEEDSAVPFYLEPGLGGRNLLRAFDWQRFSGNRMLAAQAEYRFGALRWLELAGFFDAGRAWDGFPSLSSDGIVSSYGFGARLKTSEAVVFRLDLAFGAEGARLNGVFGYSF